MRSVAALGFGLLLASGGCRSRDAEIHDIIARAATESHSGTGDDIQLAICGFKLGAGAKVVVEQLSMKFEGKDESGTGEMTAVLTGDAGLRCEGTASFSYRLSHNRDASHYSVRKFERTSPAVPLVAAVKERATPATLGTPVNATLTDDWPLLPSMSAAAYSFQIPRDGRYSFRLPRPAGSDEVWFVAYQDGHPINDPNGGITEIALVAGPVAILVLSGKPGPAVLEATAVGGGEHH